MRVTSMGQVTISQSIRQRFGLLPHTEVRFVEEGCSATLRLTAW
jgi:bifunctional DNA-binding transcriptional regulator/antitoxin component of YhaV-PrlF toxin-antitoxin module